MNFLARHKWKISIVVIVTASAAVLLAREEEKILVSVVPVHYFPPEHRVDEFYINSFYYSHSNFDGLPTSGICCIWIPEKWRSDLEVDVSWSASDWTLTPIDDKEHFNPKKIRIVGTYRAKVPVERYTEPGDLYVHFFDEGKVRVVSGVADLSTFRSKDSIAAAAGIATQGRPVSEVFTAKDMAVIEARIKEDKKRFGSWR